MTQEPKSKESAPSAEKRFVQKLIQAFIEWSPFGGSSFAFGSFLFNQEWAMALILFPVTAVSVVWGAYSKKFIEGLGDSYAQRGSDDAKSLVANIDLWNQALTETIKWQSSGFEAKYLKCQELDCHEDEAVGFRDYRNRRTRHPLLRDVFVPLELTSNETEGGYDPKPQQKEHKPKQIWEIIRAKRYRQIAIRAWGGYGKSTLLKHLAYIYSTGEYRNRKYNAPKLIPFLLYLADCYKEITKDNPPSLPELLTNFHISRLSRLSRSQKLDVPPNWVQRLLTNGEALVMFDGFDEVPPADRAKVSEWLSWEIQPYPDTVFILTSRPTPYTDDYVARKFNNDFWIKDFNPAQRQQFVEQLYLCQEVSDRDGRDTADVKVKAKERAASLLAQIESRPELNEIAVNVLLLNMMTQLHRDKQGVALPDRKVKLYQDICELQLGRRPEAKGIDYLLLNSISKRQEVLQVVALEMMKRAAVDREDVEGFKLIQRDDLLKLLQKPLIDIDPDVDASEFLVQMVQVSELLVERDGGIYQFSHLSFQEFLAATEIVRLKGEDLLYEYLSLSPWKDTILFYASLVNPTKLLQETISRNAIDLGYQISKQSDKNLNLSGAKKKELDEVKETIKALRYQKLEACLEAKEWKDADQETYRLMITAVGKNDGQFFSEDDLRNFPCDELLAIDRLWVKHSNGLYGFSVQKQIYEECGGKLDFSFPSAETWNKFCDRVAWKEEGNYVSYSNLFDKKFIYNSGHLPVFWSGKMDGDYYVVLLFSHPDL
ncbi:MAG: GUN4 domain-containing protein [Pseudanabaena sp. M109S1SP2A07QC]|jgi:hypothetical protein|nr:GUN4 domain-containing protein [Pseudanabaena sp. M109S1SP2A07QC]